MRNRYADLVALGMAVVLVIAALLFASAARGAPHVSAPRVSGMVVERAASASPADHEAPHTSARRGSTGGLPTA